MATPFDRTDIPFRQRVFLASVEEPTERVYRRMRETIQYHLEPSVVQDELLAYIDILEQRLSSLRRASVDLEAALY